MVTPTWLQRRFSMRVSIINRYPLPDPDEYGNVAYESVEELHTRGFITSVAEVDIQQGRAEVGTMLLLLPAEVAGLVSSFSQFVVEGVTYEAIGGAANPWSLIRTGINHIEMNVQRSTA